MFPCSSRVARGGRGSLLALSLAALLLPACAEVPVSPVSTSTRQGISTIATDISGIKDSDTSNVAARGKDEGGKRGAAQGMAATASSGSLLGLLLMPVGAAVGGAKGAAEAQSEDVVDSARSDLRLAMQQTDFGEDLRTRLAASTQFGELQVASVTVGAASAGRGDAAGGPPPHVLTLEYKLGIFAPFHVNPKIALIAQVTAQLQSPDRRQMLHKATWTWCGAPQPFLQVAANEASQLRDQIKTAAAVLAEAIPYDLLVSKEPRRLAGLCMDFSNLPSGYGQKAPSLL